MKKVVSLCVLLIFLLLQSVALVANAHPGRTDGRGGHTNHSTGEYHYHHGYSAHDHYDMDGDGIIDCPYDFEDKTEHKSNSAQTSKEKSKTKISFTSVLSGILAVGLYVFIMFVLPYLIG